MLELHGHQLIGNTASAEGADTFQSANPKTGEALPTVFHEATESEIDRAMSLAAGAFDAFRLKSVEERARFLRHAPTKSRPSASN